MLFSNTNVLIAMLLNFACNYFYFGIDDTQSLLTTTRQGASPANNRQRPCSTRPKRVVVSSSSVVSGSNGRLLPSSSPTYTTATTPISRVQPSAQNGDSGQVCVSSRNTFMLIFTNLLPLIPFTFLLRNVGAWLVGVFSCTLSAHLARYMPSL